MNELRARDLHTEVGSGDLNGVPFPQEASCGLRQLNDDGQSGAINMKRTPDISHPAEVWRQEGYREILGMGERIWVEDVTTDPVWADFPRISFVTRIGEWNGSFTIYEYNTVTESGALHLTDENKRRAAEFVIDWTRRVAETQPK
ncbi:hypothetical protein ACFVAV_04270 [Nocardia sp. NPDC057663]|uniref:hypothetical protein n=1 Tax=Nocardia sp. NPDC057663 TaxID=3346201 RepID=UPI0036732F93